MDTSNNTPNWKIAAAAGAIVGVGLGGFVVAGSGDDGPDVRDVQLDPALQSVPRLSAPVVVNTTIPLAASPAASITDASVGIAVPPTTTAAPVAPAPAPVQAESPPSAESPASPLPAPAPPPAADSPASPASPDSPASPASPASPGSVGSASSS